MKEKKTGTEQAAAAVAKRRQGAWSEAATRVLRERYLLRDASGELAETPDQLVWRVARAVASAEETWTDSTGITAEAMAERFYDVMASHQFLPNSPTLMNAGKGNNLQLSACYVVPVEDSLPGIFDAVKHAALIHQSGGGTGFSFSRLRPEGSMVASTHGVASGPVSFMKIFDGATEAVKQGGTRRGANMGILRVDHPDVLKFIDCKRDGSVTNFNISVAITDEFMRALEADEEYDLRDPHTQEVTKRLRAREVMDRIVSAAWATGDPGLVFLDRANHSTANPTPEVELLEATNPCFTGDTRVWTLQGPRRFDALLGQQTIVLTQTETGELVWRRMGNIHMTRRDAEVLTVRLESAITGASGQFTATGNHKLWLADGRTTTVAELRPGDRLASAYRLGNGALAASALAPLADTTAPAGVNHTVMSIEVAGRADVYCGTVEDTHRFFVVTEEGGSILAANCGEQWLGPYDACNLGSINLGIFVHDGKIDWDELERVTRVTTRFLDDVIEINPYPLEEVRLKVRANRRIGLGVMGWAEMLFELGLRYDSEEAIALGQDIMTRVRDWATSESAQLARERGAFPNWERSIYKDGEPIRNSTRTTVAPTGSISILADCSSGIEPIFALAFQHRVKQPDGSYRVLDFVNPFFKRALEASDLPDKAEALDYVIQHGSLHGHAAAGHPAFRPYVTAHEIAPEWHIRMQAAFQNGVDNSISKTINLPNSATTDDVLAAYMQAWNLGCLGITVFRDGCKGEQVLNVGVKDSQPATATTAAPASAIPDAAAIADAQRKRKYPGGVKARSEVLTGYTRQVRAPEGKVMLTLNSDEDGLLEVFVTVGRAGSDVSALAEALGRLISIHLRIDSPLSQSERAAEVVKQLRNIGGSSSIGFGQDRVRSLPDAVARAIEIHLGGDAPEVAVVPEEAPEEHGTQPAAHSNGNGGNGFSNGHHGFNPATTALYTVTGNLCPQCGNNTLHMEEGCKKCVSCGHSEC